MYLPKSVSTSASCGFRTLRPRKGIQPAVSQRMPRIISGRKPIRPLSSRMPLKMTSASAARYSSTKSSSMDMPFFLLFRIFSVMGKTSLLSF